MIFLQIPPQVWQLLPTIAKAGQTGISALVNRPKKDQFAPNLEYIDRYRSMLRDQIANRGLYKSAITPALRAIGGQARQTRQDVEESLVAGGQEGTGVAALSRLQAGEQAIRGAERVGEQIGGMQQQQTQQLQQGLRRAELEEGRMEALAADRYRQALQQYRGQLAQNIGAVGAQLTEDVAAIREGEHAIVEQLEGLKAEGAVPTDMTKEQFTQQMAQSGFTQPSKFAEFKLNELAEDEAIQREDLTGMFPDNLIDSIMRLSPQQRQQVVQGEISKRRTRTLNQESTRLSTARTRVNEIQQQYGDQAQQLLDSMGFERDFSELVEENIVDPDRVEFLLDNQAKQQRQQQQRQFYEWATENSGLRTGALLERALEVFEDPAEARRQVAAIKSGLSSGGREGDPLREFRINVAAPLGGLSNARVKEYARQYGVDPDKAVQYYHTFRETREGGLLERGSEVLRNADWEPYDIWNAPEGVTGAEQIELTNAKRMAGILQRSEELEPEEVKQYVQTRYGSRIANQVFPQDQPEAETAEPEVHTVPEAPEEPPPQVQQVREMRNQIVELSQGRVGREQLNELLAGEPIEIKLAILERALEQLTE